MGITARDVKDLRVRTGAGMMDCKHALDAARGDMEEAIVWLRKKGLAKAAKKASRGGSEGLVGCVVDKDAKRGVIVELNCETDFVARNADFQNLLKDIAQTALDSGEAGERVAQLPYPGSDKSIEEYVAMMVGRIGENLSLRRVAVLEAQNGFVERYIHGGLTGFAGKIGVLVALSAERADAPARRLAKNLAMHIAASKPLAITTDALDPALVAKEKRIIEEQVADSGKPAAIVENIVNGRLQKYYAEVALLEQIYVMDSKLPVREVLQNEAKAQAQPLQLESFLRVELGVDA